jgi:hypothetical protein
MATAVAVNLSTPGTLDTVKFNKFTCPARLTGPAKTGAAYVVGTDTEMKHSANNWWCSDGAYNLIDSTDYLTPGATASYNNNSPANWATTAYTGGQLLLVNANPLT